MQAEYERVTSKSADSATSDAKEEADSYKAQVDKLMRDKERMQVCMWGQRLGVWVGALAVRCCCWSVSVAKLVCKSYAVAGGVRQQATSG